MKTIVSLSLLVVACLSLLLHVEAGQYSITVRADQSGTWTNGPMLAVDSKVYDTVDAGSESAGGTLVNSGDGYVQIDMSILQAIPTTLSSVNLEQTTGGVTYSFWGSNTANVLGTPLATGTSITDLTSKYPATNGFPTDASGNAYQYLGITCSGGNIKLTIIIIIVVCQPCDSATTTARPTGNFPPGGNGDPQFNGLQHQTFQFHGMADESFSLISSPETRVNSLFKYIASGSCDYNDTVCWTHPGTYLDQIGLTFGHNHILLKSGSHTAGMKVYINDRELQAATKQHALTARNATAIIKHAKPSTVVFETDNLYIRIVNSDYFFNFDFGLKDPSILRAGAKQVSIVGEICELESRAPLTQQHKSAIQQQLTAAYPAYPLHGLIGQTWRNALYCGRYFEGSVDDYVTGDLFANPSAFNFFNY